MFVLPNLHFVFKYCVKFQQNRLLKLTFICSSFLRASRSLRTQTSVFSGTPCTCERNIKGTDSCFQRGYRTYITQLLSSSQEPWKCFRILISSFFHRDEFNAVLNVHLNFPMDSFDKQGQIMNKLCKCWDYNFIICRASLESSPWSGWCWWAPGSGVWFSPCRRCLAGDPSNRVKNISKWNFL